MAVINGNDFVIKYATTEAGTKLVFGHAQSASISFSNSLIETTTKDSASWMENITGKKSFTISTDGLIDYAVVATENNFEDFADTAIAGTKVFFTIGTGDGTYEGEAFIDSFEGSGGTDDVATYSVSLTGTGALAKSS